MKRQKSMKNSMIVLGCMAAWLVVNGQSITIGGEKGVSIVDPPQVIVRQNARYSLWEGVDIAIKSVIDAGISPSLENVLHEIEEMARLNDIRLPYSYSLSGKVSFSTKGSGKTRMGRNAMHRTLTPENKKRKEDFENRVGTRILNVLRETPPYAGRIIARLEHEVSQMLTENLTGSNSGGSGGSLPDWMPRDTAKKGTRFNRNDFLGREDRFRSNRFKGGYLSAEFRENFINSRMEGFNPGDAGYDAMRRKAEGAWGQAIKQYDREFMQYGQDKLREQSRLDFQNRREPMMKQQEIVRQKQIEEPKKSGEVFGSGSFVVEKLSLVHGEGNRYHGNVNITFKCKGTAYPLNSRIEVLDDISNKSYEYELNKEDWENCLLKADVVQILLEDTTKFLKYIGEEEKILEKDMSVKAIKRLNLVPGGHNRYRIYAEVEVKIEHDVFTRKLHIDVMLNGESIEWKFGTPE